MKHMIHLARRASLVALMLGATPLVLAQTEDVTDPVDPAVQETMEEGEEALESVAQETSRELGGAVLPGDEDGSPIEGQILLQSEDTILAENLIGLTVYSPTDEEVGDINDLIVSFDGRVEGAIIGVGGFLGIGEKEVAIEMQQLELIPNADEEMRLVLATSRDELEAAPEFVSKWEQEAAAEAEAMRREAVDQSVGRTVPMPVEPVNPDDAMDTPEGEPVDAQ